MTAHQAALVAFLVLVTGCAAAEGAGSQRQLKQGGEAVVPLRALVDGYSLIRDDGRTCYGVGNHVKRGKPVGCGHGCLFASSSFASKPETSSMYNRGTDFFGMAHPIVGPPDAWPWSTYSDYAWAPNAPDKGEEWITIRVATPIIVSGMEIYEINNPGAIVEIRGRRSITIPTQDPEPWIQIWSGPPSPMPDNGKVDEKGVRINGARVWRPAVVAPKTKPMDEFYIKLNTSAVAGFSQIDAVKVLGSLEDGMPISDFSPACTEEGQEDCWAECRETDLLTPERLESSIDLLKDAASWLPKLLRVAATPGRLVLPLPPNSDPDWVGCADLELPRYPFEEGLAGVELAIFPTIRPATSPLSVSGCLRSEGADAGRPVAVRVNMVPNFAEAAHFNNSYDAARDAILQQIFLSIGWSAEFHPRLVELWGAEGYMERNECPSEDCNRGWRDRYRITTKAPSITAKAAAHFGVSTAALVDGVELEQADGYEGQMLKLRVFNGELMTPSSFLELARHDGADGWRFPHSLVGRAKSAISLGLLEDLGWYFPVYEAAETLGWGHGKGLDFAASPCTSWPDEDSTYACPRLNGAGSNFDPERLGRRGCNALRTHVGFCKFVNHPLPLQDAYTYFSDPVNAVNYGGPDARADYCPLVVPEPSGLLGTPEDSVDCRQLRIGAVIGTDDYQNPGPGSACFAGRRSNLQGISGCYKHFCDSGKLSIAVGHQILECPPEGGELAFSLFAITLFCPPAAEMCPQYTSIVPPSVRAYSVTCSTSRGECRPPEVVKNGRLNVAIEITSFDVGTDGQLIVSLGGNIIKAWDEDPSPTQLRKVVQVDGLPQAKRAELVFELRSYAGKVIYQDKHTVTVNLGPVSEEATEVIDVSSQYSSFPDIAGDVGLPASAILGEQDVARAQHSGTGKAWSPSRGARGTETITLRFANIMYPSHVVLYENLSPGSLIMAEALAQNGTMVTVWAGQRDPLLERPVGYPSANGFLSSAGSTTVGLRPVNVQTDVLKLTFKTPPWPEIDTIKMVGYAELPPAVSSLDGSDVFSIIVPYGSINTTTISLRVDGTSLLFWSLEVDGDGEWPDWLDPIAPTGRFHPVLDRNILNLRMRARAPVGAAAEESVSLVIRNTMIGDASDPESRLLELRIVRLVDYSIKPVQPPALCYHGMLSRYESPDIPDKCICSPGAYGTACEYRTCPNNCTSPHGLERLAEGAAMHGVCDTAQGVCKCLPGYTGVDCSGQDGDCYISHSGQCRKGWEAGRFMLNTEDENNLNRGAGLLPKGFMCPEDGSSKCYQNMVVMQFCCRAPKDPDCPFEDGAKDNPCSSQDCREGGFDYTAPRCRAAVLDYCFFSPGDPACNAFRPLPLPAGFCPLEVALAWCAGDGADTPECFDVLGGAGQGANDCAFERAPGNPCEQEACRRDTFSEECRPFMVEWCSDHPEDVECESHLLGDECLFLPGSLPCTEAACLPESYHATKCQETVDFHCGSTAGFDDPECGMRGFRTPPPYAQPAGAGCPWDAIFAHCRSTYGGASAGCRLLQAYGALGEAPVILDATAQQLKASTAALKADAALEAQVMRVAYDAFAVAREENRRRRVARRATYLKLFNVLDGNADRRLVAGEMPSIDRAFRAARAELETSPLGATWVIGIPKDELLEALQPAEESGNFIDFSEFAAALEGVYEATVDPQRARIGAQ